MVDGHMVQRFRRHGPGLGIIGVLHNGDAAGQFDGGEPALAVVQPPGEDDSDDAKSKHQRCGTKEWVDDAFLRYTWLASESWPRIAKRSVPTSSLLQSLQLTVALAWNTQT